PTVRSRLDELQTTLTQVARKLEKIPLDAIAGDLRHTLQALTATARHTDELVTHLGTEMAPEMRSTLQAARQALASVEGTLAPDAALQMDLRQALQELSRAA